MSIARDLRALPLFFGIPEARLEELLTAFRAEEHAAAAVLFREGDVPEHFLLLTRGEVSVEEEAGPRFVLRPLAPLGELGALTGAPRSTTATATTDVALLRVPVRDLLAFFDRNPDLGFVFYKNLLGVVGDKVRRDRQHMADMRANIIRTQKAMKTMREAVLEAADTPVSKQLFETLDSLIENNRRANYRVTPPATFPASVRLDDGRVLTVLELSQGYLKLQGKKADVTRDPSFWSGVMQMPVGEIVVSGEIFREASDGVVVKLDPLVDDFRAKLDDYTTRVQLLDFVI